MQRLIEDIDRLFNLLRARTLELRFNQKDAQQLYGVCLFGSMLESMSACIILLRASNHSSVPGAVRSLLEAYVDFLNVTKDSEYLYKMEVASLHDKLWLYKAALASNGKIPLLAALHAKGGVEEDIKNLEEMLKNLKIKGHVPLHVKKRFELAGVPELYSTIYSDLCGHAHNKIDVLEQRHIVESEDGCAVMFFQQWCAADLVMYLDTVYSATVLTFAKLQDIGVKNIAAAIPEVTDALQKVRDTYPLYEDVRK